MIRTGELTEALEQWELADHPSNHTAMDFDIHSIYGELAPGYRYQKLWEAVEKGDAGKLDELIELAAHWDEDWWNVSRNESKLNYSLEKAKKVLGESSPKYQELFLYVNTLERSKVDPDNLKASLMQKGLILGDLGKLPESHIVTDHLFSLVLDHKLSSPEELLKVHKDALEHRSQQISKAGVASLNVLAVLHLSAKETDYDQLAKYNLIGWEKHHDVRFATSLLIGFIREENATKLAEGLPRALAEFPEDEKLCMLALQLAKEDGKLSTEDIVRAIKAEYRHLSVSFGIIKNSYRLKGLFALLSEHLSSK